MPRKKRHKILARLDSLIYRKLLPAKVFPTWQAAAESAGVGYSEQSLNQCRVARRRLTTMSTPDSPLTSLIENGFRVTDFGGAAGDLGDLIIKTHPTIHYTVVETPSMVNLMQQEDTRVIFTSEIPEECDVFFSSSTLQYLSNPYEILKTGFATAKRYAVIVRNNFADHERFFVQRSRLFDNGSGTVPAGFKNDVLRYPLRTIQEGKVHDIARESGFYLHEAIQHSGSEYKHGYSKDLIFKRADS